MAQTKNEFGWTLLATATASASATIDFDSGIDFTAFDAYQFIIYHVVPATTGAFLYMRTSTDGGSTYDSGASNYSGKSWDSTDGGTTITHTNADNQTYMAPFGQDVNSSAFNRGVSGSALLFKPSDASGDTIIMTDYTLIESGVGESGVGRGCGRRNTSGDVDGVQFLFSSGDIASGEFKLYGIN